MQKLQEPNTESQFDVKKEHCLDVKWNKMDVETLESEISKISREIGQYAAEYGMDERSFLRDIDSLNVDEETAAKIAPLVREQVVLLKQLWRMASQSEQHKNLLLFSRI